MKVTKVCLFNKKVYTIDIPGLTPELLLDIERRTTAIQNVAPTLNASDREFLMTGTPPEVWDAMFNKNE